MLTTDDDVVFDENPAVEESHVESWLGSNRDYTYQELLNRVFTTLRQLNPELQGEKRRYTIAPPQGSPDLSSAS